MKVLSLFDGMACGMIAMQLAGVKVESYDAYEIDKYAIKTAQHNFPMIKEHGDVFDADFTQYEGVDFGIGGSPCTHWSIAQTKNRETTVNRDSKGNVLLHQSGIGVELFGQFLRMLSEAKPKFFIYENNKSMSKEIRTAITECFGFEPTEINSALVSAQNRQRLYWVGKRNEDGTYSKVNVEQPADRGVLLRDVLDTGIAWNEKAYNLTTRCCGAVPEDTLKRHRHTMVAEPINVTADGKAQCLRATCYKDGIRNIVANEVDKKTGVAEPINDILQVGAMPKPDAGYVIEFDDDGRPIKAIGKYGKEITIYEVKDGKITIKDKQYPIKLKDGFYIIRKLTVSECKRLQTVPEWYEFPVSNSQAYKMLGNGWTCEVICHLINSCLKPADALPGQIGLWGF